MATASYTSPTENVTAAIRSYVVSYLHEGIRKLKKTCADTKYSRPFNGVRPQSIISQHWPSNQRFDVQATDRRSSNQVLT